MARDDSQIARVLGELAELGQQIGERAEALAALANGQPPRPATPTVPNDQASNATASGGTAASEQASKGGKPASAPSRGRRVAASSDGKPSGRASRPRPPAPLPAARKSSLAHGPRRARRPVGPVLVSSLMHLVVLGGLALILVARDAKPEPFVITAGSPSEEPTEEFTTVEFDLEEQTAEGAETAAEILPESVLAEPSIDAPQIEPPPLTDALAALDVTATNDPAVIPASFGSADLLADLGGGNEGSAAGSPGSSTSPAAAAPTFFGRTGRGQSVCFVCDNSLSYRDGGFHTVLAELTRAVDALRPEQSFFVIFFSDMAYPMGYPDGLETLQAATPETKQRLRAWLATVELCTGGQGIYDALEMASKLKPEMIYFLSDGDHAESIVEKVASADLGGAVLHTFGIQENLADRRSGLIDPSKVIDQQQRNATLGRMAAAHGGSFTPVTVPPQAAALEQVRPIRENRQRGAVWGRKIRN
jgi:hypothetical protein